MLLSLLIPRFLLSCFLFFLPHPGPQQDLTKPKYIRTFQKMPNAAGYTVSISVFAPGLTGFVKLTEYLPGGVETTVPEGQGCTSSQNEGKLKFIWVSFPESGQAKLSYQIFFAGEPGFHYRGELKFISKNEALTIPLAESDIRLIH